MFFSCVSNLWTYEVFEKQLILIVNWDGGALAGQSKLGRPAGGSAGPKGMAEHTVSTFPDCSKHPGRSLWHSGLTQLKRQTCIASRAG